MNTYQSFYQNEDRALEIDINDQDGNDFAPSAAWAQVRTDKGVTVIAEQPAMVAGSSIRTLIGPTVTATVGEYKVIWRVAYGGHTYYHITILEVQEW